MSYQELIEALQVECEEKVRKIWQEAEADAENIRNDIRKAADEMKRRYALDGSSASGSLKDAILSDASDSARVQSLRAEEELSRRLYHLALQLLGDLRKERREDIFAALAHEIPDSQWAVVKVNPDDGELARGFFAGAEIIFDPGVTGGLEVAAGKGKIRVVNTFEKRLQQAWPEMLPEIVKDVYREISK